MNINLFKKKTVLPVDYLNQLYVTQNEFKDLKILVKQLNKKIDEQNLKKNTKDISIPKIFKEIKYSFQSNHKKESNIDFTNPIISKSESEIIDEDSNQLIINDIKYITDKELEEKSESIIQDIHKHIQDINQYNYTINGYLLKQLRDRIEEQDKLIQELYNKM